MKKTIPRLLPLFLFLVAVLCFIAVKEPRILRIKYFWFDVGINTAIILLVFAGIFWLLKRVFRDEWLSILLGTSIAVFSAGAVNKYFHWSGTKVLLIGSLVFISLLFLYSIVAIIRGKKDSSRA